MRHTEECQGGERPQVPHYTASHQIKGPQLYVKVVSIFTSLQENKWNNIIVQGNHITSGI